MNTLDRLEKLEGMAVNSHNFQLFAEIKSDIQKLLAVVEAGDAIAFQYEGLLDWISNEECECCQCDDHDKLVEVLKAYRKAKAEVEK